MKTVHPSRRSVVSIGLALALSSALTGCSTLQEVGSGTLRALGVTDQPTTVDSTDQYFNALSNPTPEQEYYLGRAVAAQLLGRYSVKKQAAHNGSSEVEYLNAIGRIIAAASDEPDTFNGYHFAILESDRVTAMSAPGGIVFISRGFLNLLQSEEELAAVLAHEVVHLTKRHGIKALSREKLSQEFNKRGVPPGGLHCSQVLVQSATLLGAAAEEIVEKLDESGFSQDQEFEADAGAITLLQRAGYDVSGLLDVLKQLHRQRASSESFGGWFSTHPSPLSRIERLQGDELFVKAAHPSALAVQKRTQRFKRRNKRSRG